MELEQIYQGLASRGKLTPGWSSHGLNGGKRIKTSKNKVQAEPQDQGSYIRGWWQLWEAFWITVGSMEMNQKYSISERETQKTKQEFTEILVNAFGEETVGQIKQNNGHYYQLTEE